MSEPATELIEYRVRPVDRFIVTRYYSLRHADGRVTGGVQTVGEFPNHDQAYGAAYALCKVEHDRLGWPIDDARIKYPSQAEPGIKL